MFTDINVPLLMPGGNINYALNVIHAYIYLTEVGLKYAADVDLLTPSLNERNRKNYNTIVIMLK